MKEANSPISPTTFRAEEFSDPWKTDERRARRFQSRARETESLTAESIHSRSRRRQRREIVEDEIEDGETRTKPLSVVDDYKKERTDEWSVVHVPAKEEPLRMPGSLDFVEMFPKAGPVKDSVKEAVEESDIREVEIEQRSRRATPENRQKRQRWTEISKELVVRDAIERCGYEFEEVTQFYYIFSHLEPVSISVPITVNQY